MGYIVDGFCHETIEEARLHFADLTTVGKIYFGAVYAGTSSSFTLLLAPHPTATPADGQVAFGVDGISTSGAGEIRSLPVCDVADEGKQMPWIVQGAASPLETAALEAGVTLFGEPVGDAHVAFLLIAATCIQSFLLGSIRGRQR